MRDFVFKLCAAMAWGIVAALLALQLGCGVDWRFVARCSTEALAACSQCATQTDQARRVSCWTACSNHAAERCEQLAEGGNEK